MRLRSFSKMRASIVVAILALAAAQVGCESKGGDDKLPLTGPQSIQITGQDGALLVLWTKVADAQGIAATYGLWYGTTDDVGSAQQLEGDGAPVVSGNLVQATISGLTNGTTYYVWVKAFFGDLGESSFSPVQAGIPVPTPEAPTDVVATTGETLIDLTWTAPTYAFTYQVAYSKTDNGDTPPSSATVKTVSEPRSMVTGLTNGTTYYFWVRAGNTNGQSSYVKTSAVPTAATNLPAVPGPLVTSVGNKRIEVSWNAVPWATSYELYYGTTDDSASATLASTVAPSSGTVTAMIAGLTNGTAYYVWVKAVNSLGASAFSASATGTPQPAATPVDYSNFSFALGEASADYIFAEELPLSPFSQSGRVWDRLTRVKETALGDLFTDGAAWYVREKHPEQNIDFVFLNGGYIDNAILKGTVSVGTILGITDADSRAFTLVAITLSGAKVKELFDVAATVTHTGRGGPAQTKAWAIVSKEIHYTITYPTVPDGIPNQSWPQSSADAEPYYHGVIKADTLKFNGDAIDDARSYRILTTSEIADGVNGYLTFPTAGTDKVVIPTPFWHAVAEYIYEFGRITPQLDGRIVIEGGVPLGPSGYTP